MFSVYCVFKVWFFIYAFWVVWRWVKCDYCAAFFSPFLCLFSLWKVIAMTGLLLLADAVDRRVVKAESGRCVACHAGAIHTPNLR